MFTAIDLFSGAGGLSVGLREAGFDVRVAVEVDPTSASTYALNHPGTTLIRRDIRQVTGPELLAAAGLARGDLTLLTGCPPCQGFSTLRTKRRGSAIDPRNDLVFEILRLVRSTRPLAVVVENVPGLADDARFSAFQAGLHSCGYTCSADVVDASSFGVPQRRKRLVLVALKGKSVPDTLFRYTSETVTVRQAIGGLPAAGASGDPLHDLPELRSRTVRDRIEAIPKDGGSYRDVNARFWCDCHRRSNGYSDVYGRMAWDAVAPTITSGCHNPSRGRFIHPDQNRAITLREAALLQSFPATYEFDLSRGKEHAAWQIGNAFPPRLIRPIADALLSEIANG